MRQLVKVRAMTADQARSRLPAGPSGVPRCAGDAQALGRYWWRYPVTSSVIPCLVTELAWPLIAAGR